MKLWAMRGTLHLLPARELGTWLDTEVACVTGSADLRQKVQGSWGPT